MDNPILIGKWVGFGEFTELHNRWLRYMLYGKEDVTILAYRGSYKTTVLSIALAIITIRFPNIKVLFFRKTDNDVREVIVQAQKILESGVMQYFVKEIYGVNLIMTKRNNSEINTNLSTSMKGSSQIIGLGIGTSVTGKHADIVVTDDIANIKDRISKSERERTKTLYMELENIKNRDGRFINTGTPWHKEDVISIMPNVFRYNCYHTQSLISKSELADLRRKMTDSLFSANYELKHIADKDLIFINPKYTDDYKLIFDGIGHIDAGYGGSDGTAYTIFKKYSNDKIYGFGKIWDKHVDDCLSEILAYQEMYKVGSIYCEDNADKGYLRKELKARGLSAKGYHESMNKFIKISTYLKRYWNQITWIDDCDPEYINQILDYTENSTVDHAPDSASSLLRETNRTIKYNNEVKGGF